SYQSFFPAGNHTVLAAYGGDASNLTGQKQLTQIINGLPGSTTTLTSSKNPSNVGDVVTFTATVGGTSPTGTVQFSVDGNNMGGPLNLSGGVASTTNATFQSLFPSGNHVVL